MQRCCRAGYQLRWHGRHLKHQPSVATRERQEEWQLAGGSAAAAQPFRFLSPLLLSQKYHQKNQQGPSAVSGPESSSAAGQLKQY